jgi:hypothetical protein
MQVQTTSVNVDDTTLVSAHISGHTQLPQVPPQPLLPQVLPAQLGLQVVPAPHVPPPLQAPVAHLPPQPSASPQDLPVQLGVQLVQ